MLVSPALAAFSDSSFEDSTITVWNPLSSSQNGGDGAATRTTPSYDSSYCIRLTGYGTGFYNEGACDAWGWSSVYQSVSLTGMSKINFYTKGSASAGTGSTYYARVYIDDNESNYIPISVYANWTYVSLNLPAGLSGSHNVKIKVYGFGSGNWDTTGSIFMYFDDITLSSNVVSPVTDFSGSPVSGVYPLQVQFTDTSTNNPTSWYWDFGDGNTSSSQNPLKTFYSQGDFTIKHSSTNGAGTSWNNKTNYISVNSPTLQANFTNNVSTGNYPFSVSFTDTSIGTGTLSYYWDFGDGYTSTSQNVVHQYSSPGNFTVLHRVNDGYGQTSTKYVTIESTSDISWTSGLWGWLQQIWNKLNDIWNSLNTGFGNVISGAYNNTMNVTQGLTTGFGNMVSGAYNNSVNMTNSITSGFKGVTDFLTNTSDYDEHQTEITTYAPITNGFNYVNSSITGALSPFTSPVSNFSSAVNTSNSFMSTSDSNYSNSSSMASSISVSGSYPPQIVYGVTVIIWLVILGFVIRGRN